MITRIETGLKIGYFDAAGAELQHSLLELGYSATQVRTFQVYYLNGVITHPEQKAIAEKLLADLVIQDYALNSSLLQPEDPDTWLVEITFNRGVTDLVAETTLKGIRDLGIEGIVAAKTARKYAISAKLSPEQKQLIVEKLLANKVIEHALKTGETLFFEKIDHPCQVIHVPLLAANDPELMQLSKGRDLFLNLTEMQTIQAYYQRLGRNPTDIELETLAQTWSEHCSHKTLRGQIDFNGEIIDNLLKQTVFRVTEELNKSWCVSVFKDNSGVIRFDDIFNVCFKVETHNHPSAVEPYGGANTGIGGVIRDPMGTGLGAKPIINTDVFCFGPLTLRHADLPRGVLHPRRVLKGVVAGVRDYGNRMGIPTSNGAIFFDERYLGNPLVFCGNVGLIPVDKCEKDPRPNDFILVVGGRTGRDGIHGATASSGELHSESEGIWSGAVQIGNPIVEKKLVDTLLQARDRGLYRAITDCGAGGLSSAIGELAETTGAVVDLEKVPLKYHGLSYMEIWISEAQERMVIFVPPEKLAEALALFDSENVEATVIGKTTDDGQLILRYQGATVGTLDLIFLHKGGPQMVRKARWQPIVHPEPDFPEPDDLTPDLMAILAAPNVCSKEWVIRQYDHEVQGGSVLKPLVGVDNDGPGDACITRPCLDSDRAVVLANGLNPKYGLVDPYWMAASAIDEAIRNIIAVGGKLDRTALLDNFCWGNTDKPDRLGGLVLAARACYDIASVYQTPFISGKDSLNNEFTTETGETIAIPPTLLISAIAIMEDARSAISMDLKEPGNWLYVVGTTKDELGGSHYYATRGLVGNNVPRIAAHSAKNCFEKLSQAMELGLVRSCHDCSEGGIGVAIAEMAFAGMLGAEIDLSQVPTSQAIGRNDTLLFSESNSRFIVEVRPEQQEQFEATLAQVPLGRIGRVGSEPFLRIIGRQNQTVVLADLHELKKAWQQTLAF